MPRPDQRLARTLWRLWLVGALAVVPIANGSCQRDGDSIDPAAAMEMPFQQFADQKGVDARALANSLGMAPDTDLSRPLGEVLKAHGLSRADMQAAMARVSPLAAEAASKNWRKIWLKFALWAAIFVLAMILLLRARITPRLRALVLAVAVVVFGVWLGVEPNAPGTVKDGLLLYGQEGVIFPPRLYAFLAFIAMSIIGNKVFCGWGCHFGAAQDLVWHIKTAKWKPPFWLSNLIRFAFLAAVALAALLLAKDIMEPIDPFRIFRLGAVSAVAVSVALLITGVWVYRPWCNFLCPFGMVSWLAERLSICRVRVNHDTCIDCKACERACPTHSMQGIRAARTFHQDCFACGACIRTCPVTAIKWGLRPPAAETAPGE